MLVDRHRHRAVALCRELNLLLHVLPELEQVASSLIDWQRLIAMLRVLQQPDFPLAFAALLRPIVEQQAASDQLVTEIVSEIGKRLRLSNREIDDATWLLRHRDALKGAESLRLSTLKRCLAEPLAADLLALMRAHCLASDLPLDDVLFCESFLSQTPREVIDPPVLISGNELVKAGLKPGPRFKDILDRIRDAQLELRICSYDEALKLALDGIKDET